MSGGWRTRPRLAAVVLVVAVLGAGLGADPAGVGGAAPAEAALKRGPFDVLVFSRTTGFRHASIPFGVAAIEELGDEHRFGVEATEDQSQFTRSNLRRFDAVIFLNTTGTVLDRRRKRAFRRYIRRGGGYVGVHSAADTEHGWRFYNRLVGAHFLSHPIQQIAAFDNEAPRNAATKHLRKRFGVFDEHYSFKSNPRSEVRVLLTIDEETYHPDPNTSHLPGGTPSSGYMGDHPMSWCHRNLGGRAFYTALGHEPYLYELAWFRRHLLGGILIAAQRARAYCRPRSSG